MMRMRHLASLRSGRAASAGTSRRSFVWRLGAGASAALASVAGTATAQPTIETPKPEDAALRVALLEEEKVLRALHQRFEQAMDTGTYEAVVNLFAADAEVVFNGGVFSQRRSSGVSRLYRERFAAGRTGGRMPPAPGFEPAAGQPWDSVNVSPDLRSATAVFPYSIQVGMPLGTETSLAAMARLHGEGVRTWWEGGVYRIAYRRDVEGRWTIARLDYDTHSRADWRWGRSYAQPIAVARLSTRFPADPQGPDDLV